MDKKRRRELVDLSVKNLSLQDLLQLISQNKQACDAIRRLVTPAVCRLGLRQITNLEENLGLRGLEKLNRCVNYNDYVSDQYRKWSLLMFKTNQISTEEDEVFVYDADFMMHNKQCVKFQVEKWKWNCDSLSESKKFRYDSTNRLWREMGRPRYLKCHGGFYQILDIKHFQIAKNCFETKLPKVILEYITSFLSGPSHPLRFVYKAFHSKPR